MFNLFFEKYKKLILIVLYIGGTWIYFLGLILLLKNIETFNTLFFVLFFIFLLLLPIIYIFKKFNLKYLFLLILPFLYLLFYSFQLNESKVNNYELRCLDCYKYNFNLLNLVSEGELLSAGYDFVSLFLLGNKEIESFRNRELYYENLVKIDLPSQIPNAIFNIKHKKYFIYKPENYNKNNVIFVMHGSAGSFLFYLKYFKQFADKSNSILVIPVFGWGNWFENGGGELAFQVYSDLINNNDINDNVGVNLIGLSGGGYALSRIIYLDENNIFKKVLYISGVMEKTITSSKNFLNNVKNKKIYVIHGKKDDRTLYNDFLQVKNDLNNPDTLIYEDGDHFIMLNKGEEIINKIQNIIDN